MLIAALIACIIVFTHGRSSSLTPPLRQAQEHLNKDIADENRRKEALDIVDRMQKTIEALDKNRQSSENSLGDLLDKRTTSSADIQSALQPLKVDDEATCEKLLDLRFELKTVLTADEWAKVFPAPATPPSKS
jgi:hypothetical protein